MMRAFLQKHKRALFNHVKLLSAIAGFILFVLAIMGAFGTTVTGYLWIAIIVGALFGFYMFVYEMTFGPHPTGNGFD